MNTIATINFKGGVGKTTATWALSYIAAQIPNNRTLIFDLDAQMSLTQAIALNEDGNPFKDFTDWYDRSMNKHKTIFNALEEFTKATGFNFGINHDFIYKISENHHFIPSASDLYWTELDVFDKSRVKYFIHELLMKIKNSSNVPKYDHVLFDCPPSFSLLSYSVLSCCNLVLIPINPDFFAARGLKLLLDSLKLRIEPSPIPKIGVFMNRAKKAGGASIKKYSNETQRYFDDAETVLRRVSHENGLNVRLFRSPIYDKVGMKRAIQEGMPHDFKAQFGDLWKEIQTFLAEK